MQDSPDSLDLLELVGILLRHVWVILLATVICAGSTYGFFKFIVDPVYTAETQLYVNNSNKYENPNNVNINDITASQKLVNTYIVILQNDNIMEEVARQCGIVYENPTQIRNMITMKAVNNTEVLSISATSKSPELSAQIANTLAGLAPKELIRVVKAGSVEVIAPAVPPQKPSGPKSFLNGIIGGMVGAVISVLFVLSVELLDTSIKGEEDLEKHYNIAVLGEIPDFYSMPKGGYKNYNYEKYAK